MRGPFESLPDPASRGLRGTMKLLFWICASLAAYTYFGYPLWLHVLARICRRPVEKGAHVPSVSIVIAVHNEQANLPAKLENLRNLRYDPKGLQIVMVSDGSTDQTANILRQQGSQVVSVILAECKGKGFALNEAVKRATGEILVFMDARQSVDPNAVIEMVSCFADSSVGAVSGELVLVESDTPRDALASYWSWEKAVRKLESATGSVVGVTGAIYALRRELYTEIPQGTILDDVFIPMHVSRMKKRVVFEPRAIARDKLFNEKGKEFSRKVRTLTGNYQLLELAPWLLSPANPLLFRFISHKVLRLVSPVLLFMMLLAAAISRGAAYRAIFWLQVLIYVLAALGSLSLSAKKARPVAMANTFVMLNAAAAFALFNFIRRRSRTWDWKVSSEEASEPVAD